MPINTYKLSVTSTSPLEWIRTSLEGRRYKMRRSHGGMNFESNEKSIIIDGKLDVFFRCKGPRLTLVKLTIEKVTNHKIVLHEKELTIGDDPEEPVRIAYYSNSISP